MLSRAVVLLLIVTVAIPIASGAGVAGDVKRKPPKGCHYVSKRVHGKKKRVLVCKKKRKKPAPKPKPKPNPTVPSAGTVAATIPLGGTASDVAVGEGAVWVRFDQNGRPGSEVVQRIDPASNAVTATLPAGEGHRIEASGGAVWAPNEEENTVTRIDPTTPTVAATIAVPSIPFDATATPGAVWVSELGPEGEHGAVARLDPATNGIVKTIEIASHRAVEITAAAGAVWVSAQFAVVRIDPAATAIVASVATNSCGGIVGDDQTVWSAAGGGLLCPSSRGISKIDTATNAATAEFSVERLPGVDVALGFGALWATSLDPDANKRAVLARFDAASTKQTGRLELPGTTPARIAIGFGSVWAVQGATLLRITPA